MKVCGLLTLDELVTLYTVDHLTCRQIASVAGVSHAYVHRCLKYCSVPVKAGEWAEVWCWQCGLVFQRQRSRAGFRRRYVFCDEDCRRAYLKNPAYVSDRRGIRQARRLVACYFDLKPEHIVHHHDSDERNNVLRNLAVFASNADHMRYEWGGKVKPIWDGRFFRVPKGF
jgi:hypothetical protein